MIFGWIPSVTILAVLGIVALAGVVFQVLLGKRVIRFKGPAHMKVHRRVAYAIVVIAGIHGLLAFVRGSALIIGGP